VSSFQSTAVITRDSGQDYSPFLKVRLGGPVTSVYGKIGGAFMIRTLSNNSLDQELRMLMLTQLHHEVVLEFATIYLHREPHFVISPFVDVSLARDHCDTGAHLEVLLLFPFIAFFLNL
jgi:hypothetical protein